MGNSQTANSFKSFASNITKSLPLLSPFHRSINKNPSSSFEEFCDGTIIGSLTNPLGPADQEISSLEVKLIFFIANICVCSQNGEVIIESEAKCYGNIILSPRGKGGCGYDPIFEEISTGLTFAEMNNDIKDSCSHRGKALKKIIPDLIEIFS